MDGGDLVYPLPLIAAVVDTLGVAALLQSPVANISPCAAPFLGFGLLVPVGGGNGFAFVLPLFRVVDFVAVPVKNILLFLLRAPLAALLKGAPLALVASSGHQLGQEDEDDRADGGNHDLVQEGIADR